MSGWKTLDNPLFSFFPNDDFTLFHFEYSMKVPPSVLFHYTHPSSLLSIMESQYVFATERSFLNDPEEFEWGSKLIRNFASRRMRKFPSEYQDVVKKAISGDTLSNFLFFVFSLSENPDLLSQWRAYAKNGEGFCLGLDGLALRSRAGFGENSQTPIPYEEQKKMCFFYHLLPVVYEKSEQESIIEQFITAGFQCWEKNFNPKDDKSKFLFCLIFQHRLKEILISFKNPGYREEKEWRIVSCIHNMDEKIMFRSGSHGIIPFIKLNLCPQESLPDTKLSITSIWVGPNQQHANSRKSLELYLKRKFSTIEVIESKIKYR